jgi:hypothetical protein
MKIIVGIDIHQSKFLFLFNLIEIGKFECFLLMFSSLESTGKTLAQHYETLKSRSTFNKLFV